MKIYSSHKMFVGVLIMALFALMGCAIGYRVSKVSGTISGTNITTPYGPATANLAYTSLTCLGNCPKTIINMEGFSNVSE